MRAALIDYIERTVLPRYASFDAAHREEHVRQVIAQAMRLADRYPVDRELVYAAAAYHDTGLAEDRRTHHLVSGRIVRAGLEHYPALDREGHCRRMFDHLHAKYAEGGYLRLWLPDSPNAARLERLRSLIRDEAALRRRFDAIYDRLLAERGE